VGLPLLENLVALRVLALVNLRTFLHDLAEVVRSESQPSLQGLLAHFDQWVRETDSSALILRSDTNLFVAVAENQDFRRRAHSGDTLFVDNIIQIQTALYSVLGISNVEAEVILGVG